MKYQTTTKQFDGFDIEVPVTPFDLAKDPIAAKLYNQLHDKLVEAGMLTDLDEPAFQVLCQIYSKMAVEQKPMAYAELATKFTVLSKQFGLTPASRKTMKIDLIRDDDDDF